MWCPETKSLHVYKWTCTIQTCIAQGSTIFSTHSSEWEDVEGRLVLYIDFQHCRWSVPLTSARIGYYYNYHCHYESLKPRVTHGKREVSVAREWFFGSALDLILKGWRCRAKKEEHPRRERIIQRPKGKSMPGETGLSDVGRGLSLESRWQDQSPRWTLFFIRWGF